MAHANEGKKAQLGITVVGANLNVNRNHVTFGQRPQNRRLGAPSTLRGAVIVGSNVNVNENTVHFGGLGDLAQSYAAMYVANVQWSIAAMQAWSSFWTGGRR